MGKRSNRNSKREREISKSGEIGAAGGAGLPYFIIQTVSVQVRFQVFFFLFFFSFSFWRRLQPPFFQESPESSVIGSRSVVLVIGPTEAGRSCASPARF